MIDIYVIEYNDQIVYVGQSRAVKTREKQHRQSAKTSTQPLYAWMRENPEWHMRVIDSVEPNEARSAERRWINHYLEQGAELRNVIHGVVQSSPGEASTLRARKSRALKHKRQKALEKGATLIEGALVAIKGKEFSVYVWDEDTAQYLPSYNGTLD